MKILLKFGSKADSAVIKKRSFINFYETLPKTIIYWAKKKIFKFVLFKYFL